MSAGLLSAQARPSSGLARGRAGVREMVDILAIAGYSGARLYRGQFSLFKIIGKQPPCCVRNVVSDPLGSRFTVDSFSRGAGAKAPSAARGGASTFSDQP